MPQYFELVTAAEKRHIAEAWGCGKGSHAIAEELGRPRSSITNWTAKLGLPKRKPGRPRKEGRKP